MPDTKKLKQQIMSVRGLHWEDSNLGDLAGICISGKNGGFCDAQLTPSPILPDKYKSAAAKPFWGWLSKNRPDVYDVLCRKAVDENYFVGYASTLASGASVLDILDNVLAFDSLRIIEQHFFYEKLAREAGILVKAEAPAFWTDDEKRLHAASAEATIDLFLEYAATNQELLSIMADSLSCIKEQFGLFKGLAALMGEDDFFD